jgi:cytochrome c oxidase assembly factor CtaG
VWAWAFNPLPALPLVVGAIAYGRRLQWLRPRRRAPRRLRVACFWAGIAVLALALFSPLDAVGEHWLFWAHMTQHLLIGDIGPLLVVLGLSGAVLRPLLAAPGIGRLRVLAHPAVALPLWALDLAVWHLAGPYQAALRSDWLHALEHVLFFTTGALMWAAVVEPLPGPAWFGTAWKAVYTLVVRVLGAVLASAFIWSSQPFYTYYVSRERAWPIDPLDDQRIGGLIMFTEGGILTLIVFAVLFLRWTREAELRQSLIDEGHPAGAAARAARYGRSPLARRD